MFAGLLHWPWLWRKHQLLMCLVQLMSQEPKSKWPAEISRNTTKACHILEIPLNRKSRQNQHEMQFWGPRTCDKCPSASLIASRDGCEDDKEVCRFLEPRLSDLNFLGYKNTLIKKTPKDMCAYWRICIYIRYTLPRASQHLSITR